MAGLLFGRSYADYDILRKENKRLQEDKCLPQSELDKLHRYKCIDDYSETEDRDWDKEIYHQEAKLQACKYELQKKERKCQFLQDEKLRQIRDIEDDYDDILKSKQEKVRCLEKEVNNLHLHRKILTLKLGNTERNYTKVLNSCRKDSEYQIYQLQGQLRAAIINYENTKAELEKTRTETDQQNQAVYYLKKDVESRDVTIKSLENIIDNMKIKTCNKQELRQSSLARSDQSSGMNDQLRQAFTKVKELETKLKQTVFEKDRALLHTKRELERKVENDENKIRILEEVNCKTISSLKERIKLLERELDGKNMKLKRLEELKEEQHVMTIKESEEASTEIISSPEQNMQHLKRELQRRGQEINSLEEALDKTRKKVGDTNKLQRDLKETEAQLAELKDQLQQTLGKLKISEEKLEREFERGFEKFTLQNLRTRKDDAEKVDFEKINERIILSLKQKVQHLQEEIEQRDGMMACLEKAVENSNVEAEKERKLIKDLEKKENRLSEQRNQLQNAVSKLKDTEAQLLKITSERDNERHTRLDLERKAKENQKRIRELKQVNDEIIPPQKQRIQTLEREIEIRDLKENRQDEIVENTKIETLNEREKIINLMKKRDQLQQALTKLKQAEDKLNKTTSERDDERRTRQHLEEMAKENEARFKEQEQVKDEIVMQQKRRIQYVEREAERREMKLKDLEEKLDKTKAEFRNEKELGKILRIKEDRLAELKHQLQQTLVKLKTTETELEDTKTRLRKAMGDRRTDNNPNIADFPVKLTERYTELYDNKWTDAFEIVGKYFDREQKSIEVLLEILQEGDVPTDVLKYLKHSRKAMSSIPMYISHLTQSAPQTLGTTLEVQSYVQECLEICWLMVIQDPPVVFAPVAKSGSALNTDIYKPYTSSGTHVEYTVWPALLLHEGGPVLAKGVAQGYRISTSVLSR